MGVGGVGVCKSSTFSSSSPVLGNPKHCFHGIPKNSFRPLSALSSQVAAQMPCQIGHILKAPPHTEGTFARTLVNGGDLHRHSGECQEGSREYGVEGSPKFAKLRQASPKFAWRRAHASGTSWRSKARCIREKKNFGATSAKTRWRKTAWRVDALPPYPPKNRAPQVNNWPISIFLFESSPPKPSSFPIFF